MTDNPRSRTFEVEATVIVRVEVRDPDVLRRVADNHEGWRERFYDLHTDDEVVDHLAYNLAINNLEVDQLDGWADLPRSAATARFLDWLPESVVEVTDVHA